MGLSPCKDVEPIGPLPPLPSDGPKFSREYGPKELAQIASTVQLMRVCMLTVPTLRAEAAPVYARWQESRADVVGFMEAALATEIARSAAEAPQHGTDGERRRHCGSFVTSLDRQSRPADVRFNTPESAWAAFKAALSRGDAKAAAECFANPHGQFGDLVSQMSSKQLIEMGQSLVKFDMLRGDSPEYRLGFVERADGLGGEVVFVKVGAEWRISQM
jgi:hypothetical protein